jgi:hypothetical protein
MRAPAIAAPAALVMALLALGVGVGLYTDTTWEKRQYERDLARRVRTTDNFVDIGITLRVVCADPDGEQLIPGTPKLRVLRETKAGWVIDTQSRRICGESAYRRVWYCSEDQEPLILPPQGDAARALRPYGSEGSGKTSTTVRGGVLPLARERCSRAARAASSRRRTAGSARSTASSRRVRGLVRLHQDREPHHAVRRHAPADGVVAPAKQADEGSPIQSFSWSFAAGDEDQDQTDRHADIEARGRSARSATASSGIGSSAPAPRRIRRSSARTATSSSAQLDDGTKLWSAELLGKRVAVRGPVALGTPPQVDVAARIRCAASSRRRAASSWRCSTRWDRDRNLTARFRASRSTSRAGVLARLPVAVVNRASISRCIVGHDPGNIYNTSVVLRLLMFGDVPTWMVVGELQRRQTTARQHAMRCATTCSTFNVATTARAGRIEAARWSSSTRTARARPRPTTRPSTWRMMAEGLDVANPAVDEARIKRSSARRDGEPPARATPTARTACSSRATSARQPLAPVLVDRVRDAAEATRRRQPRGQSARRTRRQDARAGRASATRCGRSSRSTCSLNTIRARAGRAAEAAG